MVHAGALDAPARPLSWRLPQAGSRPLGLAAACVAGGTLCLLASAASIPQLATSAFAQGAPASPTETRRQLEQRQGALKSARQREEALAKDLAVIDADRQSLKRRLLETGQLIQKSEAKMTAIEGRLGELEAQEKIVRGSLDQRHGQIARLLGALQRMGRNPPPVMVTRRSDALQMVRSAMLLAAAFPELKGQALQLTGRLHELVRVMDDIRSESQRLKVETERLTEAQTKLAGLMEERRASLDQRHGELEEVRRAANEISSSVTDLNDLIAKLDKAVTEKTGLSAYEREIAAAPPPPAAPAAAPVAPPPAQSPPPPAADATAPPPVAPPPSAAKETPDKVPVRSVPTGPIIVTPDPAPGSMPAATKDTKVALNVPKPGEIIELKPSGAGQANPGRIKPAIPFHQAKGRLPPPAHGRTVLSFGEKTQYGGASKGIVLETRASAQITSPSDGWVVYAGEFRSYGQLLIINAGGGYHILLAGLSRIDVEPGQFVLAAEPVGTMGGIAASRETKDGAKSEANAPVLYVEFRKEGSPVDPSPWWASGPEKVQG